MRCILHIDMDAFFAAVEQLRHPQLRGRPIVVGGHGDPMERGVVSTASYEARATGIYSGMPLRTAYQRCPDCIFLPVDYSEYVRISIQIKDILKDFSTTIEDVGIDEAFLDLSSQQQDPRSIAMAIKRRIRQETGLSCSIGIAPNKLLAKLASGMNKPDGLVILREDDLVDVVWPLPVRKLWGVGPKTEQRLAEQGISTIGELAALPEEVLKEYFGQAHGHYLYEASHGINDRPLVTHWEPKSLSHETTFQRDTGDWEMVEKTLRNLTGELVARLREEQYLAGSVTVKLRYADFETHTHSRRLPAPGDDLPAISDAIEHCLRQFAITKKVRLVGVRLADLSKA